MLNLISLKLRSFRKLGIFVVGYGDLERNTIRSQYVCADLRIRHSDRKHFTILHCNGQSLFARKRLYTNQSPVSGFHRLRIDLRNLLLCQFCTILAFQPVGFLQSANCSVAFSLSDPYQLR